mmetsp:Transcript_13071/g.24765  ORF Transcript_13071/g.24765 Transcript_13071/m.24765 type:complete len:299 (-) Transcript_13071:70-966(-)
MSRLDSQRNFLSSEMMTRHSRRSWKHIAAKRRGHFTASVQPETRLHTDEMRIRRRDETSTPPHPMTFSQLETQPTCMRRRHSTSTNPIYLQHQASKNSEKLYQRRFYISTDLVNRDESTQYCSSSLESKRRSLAGSPKFCLKSRTSKHHLTDSFAPPPPPDCPAPVLRKRNRRSYEIWSEPVARCVRKTAANLVRDIRVESTPETQMQEQARRVNLSPGQYYKATLPGMGLKPEELQERSQESRLPHSRSLRFEKEMLMNSLKHSRCPKMVNAPRFNAPRFKRARTEEKRLHNVLSRA